MIFVLNATYQSHYATVSSQNTEEPPDKLAQTLVTAQAPKPTAKAEDGAGITALPKQKDTQPAPLDKTAQTRSEANEQNKVSNGSAESKQKAQKANQEEHTAENPGLNERADTAQADLDQSGNNNLARLNATQKDVLILKAQLEREKIQKELRGLKAQSQSTVQAQGTFANREKPSTHENSPGQKNFSDLTLGCIYGTPDQLKASVRYLTGPELEIAKGDVLPSGEKIIEIEIDHLTIEFNDQKKRIAV